MGKLIPPVVAAGTMSDNTQPDLVLGDDLALRPFVAGDAAAVVEAFSTPDIQHFHFRRFDTEAEASQWIADAATGWTDEKSATWAIVEPPDDTVLGRITIYANLTDGYGEVSYWLLPRGRGRGFATRACIAATEWAHDLGLHRIELQHSTTNEPSRQVAERAGYRREGVRRGANLHDDGWHDMVAHSHLASDP